MLGERLSRLVSLERLKLAAGIVLLSPFLPLLFQGEEYGETAPFLYFISHEDPELVEAVRRGRREEFAAFAWQGEPPDPQSEQTFLRSRLDESLAATEPHRTLLEFHRELLRLRREHASLRAGSPAGGEVLPFERQRVLAARRQSAGAQSLLVASFGEARARVPLALPPGRWRKVLDSSEERWRGPGAVCPDLVDSAGEEIAVELAPSSLALFLM
jgi:maltooligosyltrehalose trehalohydrolase